MKTDCRSVDLKMSEVLMDCGWGLLDAGFEKTQRYLLHSAVVFVEYVWML